MQTTSVFVRLWLSVLARNTGDGILLIAIPWLASTKTANATLVAAVVFSGRVPWLLVTMLAGVVADRVAKLPLMKRTVGVRCLTSGAFTLVLVVADAPLWLLAMYALSIGVLEVFFDNTAEAVVPEIVPAHQLEQANSRVRTAELIANNFLGAPLGGILVAASLAAPFFLDSLLALVAFAALLGLPGRQAPSDGPLQSIWRDIKEGLAVYAADRRIRWLLAASAVVGFSYALMLGTQVLFIREVVGIGPFGYGLLLAVSSLSSLAGAQLAPHLTRNRDSLTVYRIALVFVGASLTLVGVSRNAFEVGFLYAIAGAGVVVAAVSSMAVRQRIAPQQLLGRATALFRVSSWGFSAIGILASGPLVELVSVPFERQTGLRSPFIVGGLALLLTGSLFRVRESSVGDAEMEEHST